MADEPQLRAFLSYSDADESAARTLRRRLERFRVPRALHASHGRRLGPFFPTDRSDHGPAEAERLADAEHLLVLCGPTTPDSERVAADIDTYLRLRGHEHVIMVLLDGDPREALPQRLRGRDPIVADFRANGDGAELALLRLAAALLRVDVGVLRDRQAADERDRLRVAAIASTGLAVATIASAAAGFLIWQERERAETMARAAIDISAIAITQADEFAHEGGADILGPAEARLAEMYESGVDSQELRLQRALLLVQFAELYNRRGDVEAARERAEAAIEIYNQLPPHHRQTLQYVSALALVSQGEIAEGRTPEAINFAERAVEAARVALVESPEGRRGNAALAEALMRLGDLYVRAGRPQDALAPFQEAIPALEATRAQSPGDDDAAANLYAALDKLARAQEASARFGEARETCERVTALARERLAANPRSGPARAALGDALEQLARIMVRQDDARAARAPLLESLAIARGLAALQPDDTAVQRTFSRRLIYTATVLLEQNRAAPELIEEAIIAARADVRGAPNDAEAKVTLAAILAADAARMERGGEMNESRTAWYEVVQLRRALIASTRDDAQRGHAGDLATAWERIARINLQTDQLQNALGAYNEAIRARRAALNGDAENRARRAALADTLHATGLARLQGEYLNSARTAFDEAARLRITLAEEVASDDAIAFAAVESLQQVAQINATENPTAAERNLEAARSILDRVAEASPNARGRVARYRAALARVQQTLDAAGAAADATPTQ
jgi:tetratricopeptide (TPR) repeat protein